jgi:NAD(P)-dependent dehydrogenase (short-subunit alcohol dehydrogenase family)
MAANLQGPHVWLIAGCSNDVGRELAALVLRRGGRAILASADPAGLVDLVASYPTAARTVALDPAQIADALAIAERGLGPVDVFVDNAEDAAEGLVVAAAVLPGICARGAGQVVRIGRRDDGLTQLLAGELASLGIRVVAVEPNAEAVIRAVETPVSPASPVSAPPAPEQLQRILRRLSGARQALQEEPQAAE